MTPVLVILGALIALHAVVAACELGVMTARPARLQILADRGSRGARRALLLQKDSARLLSTVHLLMTMTAIVEGAYGERELSHHLEEWLHDVPSLASHAETISFVVVITTLSYLLLVLGELVLSYPYAERQATNAGHPVAEELALLTVHGVLHLLGYDHLEPEDQAAMWAKTNAILATLGVGIRL